MHEHLLCAWPRSSGAYRGTAACRPLCCAAPKLAGVASVQAQVTALCVTPTGSHVVSAAATERGVAVFPLAAMMTPRKSGTVLAVGTLAAEHTIASIACASHAGGFRALLLSDGGAVSVWDCSASGSAFEAAKLCTVIVGGTTTASPENASSTAAILAAAFQTSDGTMLAATRLSAACCGVSALWLVRWHHSGRFLLSFV
jgi:hypothetical protein